MKDDSILQLNKSLMLNILENLNKSSPIYNFNHLASRDGGGSVGSQYGIYHDAGNWLINVSTDATNTAESFAVELSIKNKHERSDFNHLIEFANSCAQQNKLGPANIIKSEKDNGVILMNHSGSTELTEIGDNGPYIRLAKYRKIRAKTIQDVISMVNDCFVVVSILDALKTQQTPS